MPIIGCARPPAAALTSSFGGTAHKPEECAKAVTADRVPRKSEAADRAGEVVTGEIPGGSGFSVSLTVSLAW
jgi:hypothetical protein